MKQNQINYLNMVAGVIAGMRKEQLLWENEPEIVSLFTLMVSEFDQVASKNESISGTNTTGYTSAKDNTFDRIIAASFKLARKLSAYAKIRKNLTLLPLVDVSISTLSRGMQKDAVSRCAALTDQAQSHLDQLTTFKVTLAEITAIRQLIAEYNTQSGERTSVSSNKSVTGKEVTDHISGLRDKLDTMDDLIEGLIDDDGFISRYKSLRAIIDNGVGKTLKNKEQLQPAE